LFGLLAVALMATVWWMSGRTSITVGTTTIRPSGAAGNLAHVVTFACLGWLLSHWCDRDGWSAGLGVPAGKAALAVATAFGLADEVHQSLTPGRVCSAYDVVLDVAGAAVALLLPWLRGPGRPRSPAAALAVLAGSLVIAVASGRWRPPGDDAIEASLAALGLRLR
jgi:VanZ family protein